MIATAAERMNAQNSSTWLIFCFWYTEDRGSVNMSERQRIGCTMRSVPKPRATTWNA